MESFLLFLNTWKWQIILAISILAFILQALITNKLNKNLYGRNSIFAFLPFLNMFTLGKVCADEIVGLVIMAMLILCFRLTIPINGVDKTYAIIPESTAKILFPYCIFIIVCLYIYSIFKYIRSIKDKKGKI